MDQNEINEIAKEVLAKGTKVMSSDGDPERYRVNLEKEDGRWTLDKGPHGVAFELWHNLNRMGHYVPSRKYYYLFLGGGASEIFQRSRHFVVESDHIWTADKPAKGKVIGRNKNANWELGYEAAEWAHPAKDAAKGLFTSFVPVPPDYAKENMFSVLVAESKG